MIENNIPLALLTTFAIGGTAQKYVKVTNTGELLKILQWTSDKKIPFKLFAGGSNVVFPDESIIEMIIQISGGAIKTEGNILSADAGAQLADVVNVSIDLHLEGLENLSGIPGTVGGAVFGNAGAYGCSVSDVIEKVQIWDHGVIKWLTRQACEFSYRDSIFKRKHFVILQVVFHLQKMQKKNLKQISQDIIFKRAEKYHTGLKCPGSFFKNIIAATLPAEIIAKIPEEKIMYGKIPAGFLLEEVGAKGMRVGDIAVANYHGNLLINLGNGKAADVKQPALLLKEKVRERFHIELEEEIRYF